MTFAPHENANEIVAGRLAKRAVRKTDGGVRDDSQVASKIVRGLAPQIAPLLFQRAYVCQRTLQIFDVAGRFLLLELKVLSHALLYSRAAQHGPGTARRRDCSMRYLRLGLRIVLQFGYHAFIELYQLASDFPQIIALLPSLQSVGGRRTMSRIADPFGVAHAWIREFPGKCREQRENMI